MSKPKISTTIALDDIQAATAELQQLRDKMKFLIELTPDQREECYRKGLGPITMRQLEDRLHAARKHREALPSSFELRQFERDMELTRALYAGLALVQNLQTAMKDTLQFVGNRSVQAGLVVYNLIKAASGLGQDLQWTVKKLTPRRSPRSLRPAKLPAPAMPASTGAGATP